MAIKWEAKFTLKATGHYSATFRRFDDADPSVMLGSVEIGDAILETDEQKKALWDLVWAQYEKRKPIIDPATAELESAAKLNLEAKENNG